ncbi:MAG: hypothetical protein R3F59_30785 [Myxococcota bacterium]
MQSPGAPRPSWCTSGASTPWAPAEGTPLPSWFYRQAPADRPSDAPRVRDLPADSGIRDLPVIQAYAPRDDVPLALEVGFGPDAASAWWPQVDRRVSAPDASSPLAVAGRGALLAARAARTPMGPNPPLGPDPTKQLGWDALTLSRSPATLPKPAEVPWVQALRDVPGALWVDATGESDRFVFYEAQTHDRPDLVLERGETWSPSRPHLVLRNVSDWTVHDVVVIADGRAWTAPAIPPGATAGFLLDQPLDRDAVLRWLRARWTDPGGPPGDDWMQGDCVMMRDPAVPTEVAADHRLYAAELDVLLGVWADRLLAADGARVVYREDEAALQARVPLAVYTDMRSHVALSRLGVAVIEGVTP